MAKACLDAPHVVSGVNQCGSTQTPTGAGRQRGLSPTVAPEGVFVESSGGSTLSVVAALVAAVALAVLAQRRRLTMIAAQWQAVWTLQGRTRAVERTKARGQTMSPLQGQTR